MKQGLGRRALSLALSLALVLSLLPAAALAGSQDWLEAFFYDNNRMESYGFGTQDNMLVTDADGTIRFSVSAYVSLPGEAEATGLCLVDADSRAEKYDLLDPAYKPVQYDEDVFAVESYESDYSLSVWLQGFVIPNAALGDYRLKVVTTAGTFFSEAVDSPDFPSTGIVTVADGADYLNKPVIETSSLPMATMNRPYTCRLEARPCVEGAAITWSLAEGSLPNGLTLSPDGLISGTPTEGGASYAFTVAAAEAGGETATRAFSLYVG